MLARATTLVPLLLAAGTLPAAADGLSEAQAKGRLEAAGYTGVGGIHQGNLGDWMAEADKDGQHVLVVVHADGSVALRQQVQLAPVKTEPLPSPSAMPKP